MTIKTTLRLMAVLWAIYISLLYLAYGMGPYQNNTGFIWGAGLIAGSISGLFINLLLLGFIRLYKPSQEIQMILFKVAYIILAIIVFYFAFPIISDSLSGVLKWTVPL